MDYEAEGGMDHPEQSQTDRERRAFLDIERERAACRIAEVSGAVRDVVERLGGGTLMSRLADQMAGSLDRAGRYVQDADPKNVVRDTTDFARRRPETFLGGAFLAGAVLGRFLRSEPPERAASTDAAPHHEPTWESEGRYGESREFDAGREVGHGE